MALSEEDIARIRSKFRKGARTGAPSSIPAPVDPQTGLQMGGIEGGQGFGVGAPRPERGDPSALWRSFERGGRLAGLAIGTGVAVNPLFAGLHLIPGVKDWLPDITNVPGGARAFWDQAREGDWDAAIEAYQDELDAGPGYWGAAEIAGSLIPTGGPAIAGTKLIGAAPKLAGTLGKVLPATRGGVKVRRGIEEGLTEVGKIMRLPWEAEEAAGRGALKGLGLTARSVRHPMTGPLAQAMARARASIPDTPVGRAFGIDEVPPTGARTIDPVEATGKPLDPTTPPPPRPDVGDARPGVFEGGGKFVTPLRHLREIVPEVKELSNRALRALAEASPFKVNPSALRGSQAHRIATAVERVKIDVDQTSDLVVSAALDRHGAAVRGMAEILPIDKDGFFGDTGKLWQDVFSNYKNPAYRLTEKQTAYVEDFLRVLDEVEEMRVAAGMNPRAQVRKKGQFYVPRSVEELRGLEVGRTSPWKRRIYEEATEGYAQGVRYSNDPRATLLANVRAAYKEVLESQLDEMIEPISFKMNQSILKHLRGGKELLAKYRRALSSRDEARKAVSEKRYSAEGKRKIDIAVARVAALREKLRDLHGAGYVDDVLTDQQIKARNQAIMDAAEGARQADLLPRELAGAKPGYNMGPYRYTPQFESDVDKALFIVSQAKRSARDSAYMDWLRGRFPGLSDEQLRASGRNVREHIKATLRGQPEGDVRIPLSTAAKELGVGRLPTPAATATRTGVDDVLTDQRQLDDLMKEADELQLELENVRAGRELVPIQKPPRNYPGGLGRFSEARLRALAKHEGLDPYESDWFDSIDLRVVKEVKEASLPRVTGFRKIKDIRADIADINREMASLTAPRRAPKVAPALRRTPEGQRLRDAARAPLEKRLEAANNQLNKLIKEETDKLVAVQKGANKAVNTINKDKAAMVQKAKDDKRVPGRLFGPDQPDEVLIKEWKNRFFKKEDFLDLERGLERTMNPQGKDTEKKLFWFWRGFQTVGNTIRFLAAVGDSGMPLIHGLPLLARNPAGWARMAYHHTNAFLDPAVQGKLIYDNLADYQWLARNQVPIGDPEFFAALAPGQGLSLEAITRHIARVTGDDHARGARILLQGTGKQVFGRFQAAYNTGLGWSRVELLRGARGGWKGTDAELAQYIRNMTGGLDSRALGVGPTQRAIEGMFLAFSPRLLRSTTALMIDAARPWTPQGREALISLGRLAGGVLTLYSLSGIALGNAQGKTMEEIRKDTLEGMNPLSGRRFLSHNINGDWIGVGGQVRAVTQFMASMYSTLAPGFLPGGEQSLESMWDLDMYENPFMRFYASRGAPGVSMIAGAIEAGTQGRVDALPFDQIDGIPDLGLHLATSALPFTIQSALEGASFGTVATEFFGLRGGTDPRDVRSQEVFDEEYRDIEPFMQRMIRETVEGQDSEFDKIEQGRRDQLLELLGEVRSGQRRDSFGIWLEVRKINNRASGARRYAGERIEFKPADVDADKLGLQALNQRNELYDDPEVMSETGRMKYVTVGGKSVSVFSIKLAAIERGWSEAQKGFVVRNTNTRPIPIELVAVLPEEQRRSIGLSQTAREQYLIDRGYREEAQLLRRLFSLEPVGK